MSASRKHPDQDSPNSEEPTEPEQAPEQGPEDKPAKAAATDDGALVVDVMANLTLQGGEVLEVNQERVTVPDTAEVRACITNGYLRLSD